MSGIASPSRSSGSPLATADRCAGTAPHHVDAGRITDVRCANRP
ncbi:hypothetical protein [Micromonospora sp. HNM0581]|nr:hypothetical protein [Micromonospora sp. HNM0581]